MALLASNKITKANKSKASVHKAVTESTYTSFTEIDGNKYFQIDMYGSEQRKHPEKISQSIQFDKETACYLVKLISKELGLTTKELGLNEE